MLNGGATDGARLIWRGGTSGTQEYRARVGTSGALSFFPAESGQPGAIGDVFAMTQAGDVGIGTANPTTKLQVAGKASATGF